MNRSRLFITLIFFFIMISGCAGRGGGVEPPINQPQPDNTPAVQATQFGEPVTVPINGRAQLPKTVTLEFNEVTNDSRCPVDVTCVWAGEAEIHGRLLINEVAAGTFDLVVPNGGSTAESEGAAQTVAGYTVTVLALNPAAEEGVDLSDRYEATFVVSDQDS